MSPKWRAGGTHHKTFLLRGPCPLSSDQLCQAECSWHVLAMPVLCPLSPRSGDIYRGVCRYMSLRAVIWRAKAMTKAERFPKSIWKENISYGSSITKFWIIVRTPDFVASMWGFARLCKL